MNNTFTYTDERFADIQMLRYRLNGFEQLTLRQKNYIYYLAQATLAGRDITTDQQCRHNLRVRKTLEAIYRHHHMATNPPMLTYLKQVWFANGIHHHYGSEKFIPGFTPEQFRQAISKVPPEELPLDNGETPTQLADQLQEIIFNPTIAPKRVNLSPGNDLIQTSACNYYERVTQQEAEAYYAAKKNAAGPQPPSHGLNTKLVKDEQGLHEIPWTTQSLYAEPLKHIVDHLRQAQKYTENPQQEHVIELLIRYYETGDLRTFDEYSIEWLKEQDGTIDFINGFIEVYGDPLGIKASWEGLVEYKDHEATRRTQTISQNAQWFEGHSPVDPRFKKEKVTGVSATVINAAMLGGDEYPASAIGINLPNADWIREQHGSKSVTIGNLTEAYNQAALGNGFYEEFVADEATRSHIKAYGHLCDDLHTDLHECLGHGSGQILPTTSPDALKAYGSTIEEARADLFALYYIADPKMQELGLLQAPTAYQAQYYIYLLNGLLTQSVRIKPGAQIEEAHMRNRALIANWTLQHAEGTIRLEQKQGKTYLAIDDYQKLRQLFATLLAEIQRIKSEGDEQEARRLVETYGVKIQPELHRELLERYQQLNIAPYKGFINPKMNPQYNENGEIVDIQLDYTETYTEQMLRYSREFGYL